MAGPADTQAIRGLTNILPLAGIMRWNWKMVQRQPVLVTSVVLSVVGTYFHNKKKIEANSQLILFVSR